MRIGGMKLNDLLNVLQDFKTNNPECGDKDVRFIVNTTYMFDDLGFDEIKMGESELSGDFDVQIWID